jgi:hypothetical protein
MSCKIRFLEYVIKENEYVFYTACGLRHAVSGIWIADLILYQIIAIFDQFWRDGRVVECGGLENRCPPIGGPGVRTPLSPQGFILALQGSPKGIAEGNPGIETTHPSPHHKSPLQSGSFAKFAHWVNFLCSAPSREGIIIFYYISIPAKVAEIYEAIVPQIIALNPNFARSALRFGTITPIPPS